MTFSLKSIEFNATELAEWLRCPLNSPIANSLGVGEEARGGSITSFPPLALIVTGTHHSEPLCQKTKQFVAFR